MCKIALSISLLLIPMALSAQFKTAEDFFHGGAQLYINGKKEAAKREIVTGLNLYPRDPQLNGLAQLIKQEEQQQQQQQNQKQDQSKQEQNQQKQNQSQQQKSEQKQSEQSKQDQQKQDQQKQEQQQQQQAAQAQEKKDQQPAQGSAGEKKDHLEDKDQEQAAYAAGQMSPEQAEQLLDAQKGEEQLLQFKAPDKPRDPNRPVRDW